MSLFKQLKVKLIVPLRQVIQK